MITVLVAPEELSSERLELAGAVYRHLFRSRRLAPGARLRLVDGRGSVFWGTVEAVDRRKAQVVRGETAPSFEPCREVRLLVAAPRFQRASWLVEKAVELGVARIHFLSSARSPRDYGSGSLERLQRVAAAALQQCHGSVMPNLSGVGAFEEIPELSSSSSDRRVLDPSGERSLPGPSGSDSVCLAIGPEGGWTAEELSRLGSWGFVPLSLGRRVLRVETAAIVASGLFLLPAMR